MTPQGIARGIGIDFGTTNSTVAVVDAEGRVHSLRWPSPAGPTDVFRTALTFWSEGRAPRAVVRHVAGPEALARALASDGSHRFVQSIKSYLATASFTEARLFAQRFSVEQLVTLFLDHLIDGSGQDLRAMAAPIVAGRPVVFAGAQPDPALAVSRLETAFAGAGLRRATFAYEPLGAAYWYARDLRRDETVLVADFGGGTSDFSVIRFTRDPQGRLTGTPLAHAGVGVAGDTFDFRLVDHLVAPQLGKGSYYRSFGKRLPFPAYVHATFAQWHQLSWLKAPQTLRDLKDLAAMSEVPAAIETLIDFLDYDLGFELYQAISRVKTRLSTHEAADLAFDSHGVRLSGSVTRAAFEQLIASDLARIAAALEQALHGSGCAVADIDAVFLTGGTSYVPAVRALFQQRFEPDRIHVGEAFQSVASGLALLAADRARQRGCGTVRR